tara:strand:+ start:169 stop:570 length:402 start_codon:yes stop_codon:yes gene_type:complete
MSQPYALFHRERFPLIVIEFTGTKETSINFNKYLKGLEENYANKTELALVFDARKSLSINPIYQAKQAAWMQTNKDLIKQYCKGIAYIVPNPILRKMLQLIFKITPNPVPFCVFEGMEQGADWAKQQISELQA